MADRLITAADIETWQGPGPVHVPDGVVITPAAVDRAAELGVAVVFCRAGEGARDGRSLPAGAGEVELCPMLREVLADGAYFIRIPREPGAEFIVRVTESGCELGRKGA